MLLDDFQDFPIDMQEDSPIIKVIGVGGGGCNVAEEIYKKGLRGVGLMVCNTDQQALDKSMVSEKILLGANLTRINNGIKGLGTGQNPKLGKEAAESSIEEIKRSIGTGTHMVFITACLGGGTGTGAAPVIAKVAKERGILTIGVITIPFRNEGTDFMNRAISGYNELKKYTDSLLIIDNEKINEIYRDLTMQEAYGKVNDILVIAVKGISDMITTSLYSNVDFADVRKVIENSGTVFIGTGEGEGRERVETAVRKAFDSPLIVDCDLTTSKALLMTIVGPENLKQSEHEQAKQHALSYTGNCGLKAGWGIDNSLGDKVQVAILAAGFNISPLPGSKGIDADNLIFIDEKGERVAQGEQTIKRSHITTITADDIDISAHHFSKQGRPALITDNEAEIEELENTPAYGRDERIVIGTKNEFGDGSFFLSNNGERTVISTDNSFLHKTQD